MPSQMIDGLLIPGLELGDAVEVVVFGNTLPAFTVANDDRELDVDDDPMVVGDN